MFLGDIHVTISNMKLTMEDFLERHCAGKQLTHAQTLRASLHLRRDARIRVIPRNAEHCHDSLITTSAVVDLKLRDLSVSGQLPFVWQNGSQINHFP